MQVRRAAAYWDPGRDGPRELTLKRYGQAAATSVRHHRFIACASTPNLSLMPVPELANCVIGVGVVTNSNCGGQLMKMLEEECRVCSRLMA